MRFIRHLKPNRIHQILALELVILLGLALVQAAAGERTVSYNRQIRPILSDKCFLCHGPDPSSRKAKLRLDLFEAALEREAFVPGRPEESELIRRVFADDPLDIMPPPEMHKALLPQEKELLRAWIAEGAQYEPHWSYVPPVKPSVPAGTNAIDYLVRTRLQGLGLHPSAPADRRTLIRRLHSDLTGLPPTAEAVAAFERDSAPDAYPRLVESLLASPHYGERMAIPWLDVVRFADTIGYHSDNPRNVWPYRDYVIRGFNENKPFDVFTREQLAGDLLPNPGLEQQVGSAFNRLLLTTEEGGAQPKDYEYRMLTDRVRAVGTVWLGQTFGCAACHDHKFDPITMNDFYALGAVFADIQESIIGQREPGMFVPDAAQSAEWDRLRTQLADRKRDLDEPKPALQPAFQAWLDLLRAAQANEKYWTPLTPASAVSAAGASLKPLPDASLLVQGPKPEKDTYQLTFTNLSGRLAAVRIDTLPDDSLPGKGPGRAGNGNFVLTEVILRLRDGEGSNSTLRITRARADVEQTTLAEGNPFGSWSAAATIDGDAQGETWGWAILPSAGQAHYLVLELAEPVQTSPRTTLQVEMRQQHGKGHHTLGRFRIAFCAEPEVAGAAAPWPPPADLAKLLEASSVVAAEAPSQDLWTRFKSLTPLLQPQRDAVAQAEKALADFEAHLPRCLVTVSSPQRRSVHILPRGDFLKESNGPVVEPAFPAYLPPPPAKPAGERLTRLDLANWLVSPQNPLTARVTMNRLWKHFFGTGLSRVLDDLGSQGEIPPNQALLDWLACEFVDSGWDYKHMVRLLVSSDCYRQSSIPSPELRTQDPLNREVASQGRWRLDAELVRDAALSFGGLLNLAIGGPSAKPYQPEGYWENLNFPTRTYDASSGGEQYRRGLYTWWQRSYLHPSLVAFDAPSREECAAERIRSNIPQQALVLLNDPTYVEAARAFGLRILREGGTEAPARVQWAWRQALAREAHPNELTPLLQLLATFQRDYAADPAATDAFLAVGQLPVPEGFNRAEVAAWTQVARVIINLHETITRD